MKKLIAAIGFSLLTQIAPANAESLLSLYREAVAADAKLAVAKAQFEAVTHARPQVRSVLYPQVSGNISYEYIDQSYDDIPAASKGLFRDAHFERLQYGVNVTQSLYDASLFDKLDQVDGEVARAAAELKAAEQELISRLAVAYFEVLAAQNNLDFARAEKTAISQQLHETRQRFDIGTVAITDVQEVQAQYDLSIAQEASALYEVSILKENLRVLLGRTPGRLASLKMNIPIVQPTPRKLSDWADLALANSHKLRAAQLAVEVADDEVNSRKGKHLPTLDLKAEYTSEEDRGGFNEGRSTDALIGLKLNVPIYSGGRVKAEIQEARSLKKRAEKDYSLQKREILRQTRAAYLKVISGVTRVKALKRALESTRSAADAAETGYRIGTRTPVDMLLAQRETYRAQRDYARARYDYLLNMLELRRAAGILKPDFVNELDALMIASQGQ